MADDITAFLKGFEEDSSQVASDDQIEEVRQLMAGAEVTEAVPEWDENEMEDKVTQVREQLASGKNVFAEACGGRHGEESEDEEDEPQMASAQMMQKVDQVKKLLAARGGYRKDAVPSLLAPRRQARASARQVSTAVKASGKNTIPNGSPLDILQFAR